MLPLPNKALPLLASALALMATPPPAPGFEPLEILSEDPRYTLASHAMADGLHRVAAHEFALILRDDDEGALTADLRDHLVSALVEAQVRSGDGAAALQTLQGLPEDERGTLVFWRGLALADDGRPEEAVAALADVTENSPHHGDAALARASLLVALGKRPEATAALAQLAAGHPGKLKIDAALRHAELLLEEGKADAAAASLADLGDLTPAQGAARDYILARLEIARGDHAAAAARLEPVAAGRNGVGRRLNHAVRLALSDAYTGAGQNDKAIALLDAFVSDPAGSPLLGAAFQRMAAAGMLDGEPGAERLAAWAAEDAPHRAGYARYHLAKERVRAGETAEAAAALEAFLHDLPGHPIAGKATVELAELYTAENRFDEALTHLARLGDKAVSDPALKARLKFVQGLAHFGAGEHADAATAFDAASETAPGDAKKMTAALNAAISKIKAGGAPAALALPDGLPVDTLLLAGAELQLERGLYEASLGNPHASTLLGAFLQANDSHPRAPEANLALAELHLLALPPRIQSAQDRIRDAREQGIEGKLAERADYIAVWAAAGGEEPGALAAASNAFLETWPESEFRDEVRMRLGEYFYHGQDYANAQTQFELLASESPDSPHAEAALFFAGRAAMSLLSHDGIQRAIAIWGKLAERSTAAGDESPAGQQSVFGLYGRYFQAVAKRREGKHEEALHAFEGILLLDPPPPAALATEIRLAMGEALMLLGEREPNHLQRATELFSTVAAADEQAASFRASYLLSKCYEQMGEGERSLAASYAPIATASTDLDDPAALHWFYRSGFNAISLLTKRQEWEAAVKVAERMARTPGSRAEEARLKAERLRLEHFIWEED